MSLPRQQLLRYYQTALQAVHGTTVVREHLSGSRSLGPVALIAIGKAACAMASGAHEALGESIREALIITKHGYAEPLPWPVHEAGHPLPDAASVDAGAALLNFIGTLAHDRNVLLLLSGGASALVEVPAPGMGLAQLQELNRVLLGSGLPIGSMNVLRKRCSQIKGGRLARHLAPRPVLCLAISDVPGDAPSDIGSGPVSPDPDLGIEVSWPVNLSFPACRPPPAPRPDDACFRSIQFRIVATNAMAIQAAAQAARQDYPSESHATPLTGDAVACGTKIVDILRQAPPGIVHIWGGETTVRLPASPGRGGRNQSLALAAAVACAGQPDLFILAAGTDGSDGPGQDAGALVDGETVARGHAQGLDAAACLAAADAGRLLAESGDLIYTGPTGTNVMDLVLGLRLS